LFAPTKSEDDGISDVDDYRLKHSYRKGTKKNRNIPKLSNVERIFSGGIT
jgi:hypothetical protein